MNSSQDISLLSGKIQGNFTCSPNQAAKIQSKPPIHMDIFQPSGMEIESLTGNYQGIHKQTNGAGLTTKSDRLVRSFNYDL